MLEETSTKKVLSGLLSLHHESRSGNLLQRLLFRTRVKASLMGERERLSYHLIHEAGPDGTPYGLVLSVPVASAEHLFATYGAKPAFFGFVFGGGDPTPFDVLIERMRSIAAGRGIRRLFGPFDPTINYTSGMQASEPEFRLNFLMPQNPVRWSDYFRSKSSAGCPRLLTFDVALDGHRLDTAASVPEGIVLKPLFDGDAERSARVMTHVVNSGWRTNWGYVSTDEVYARNLFHDFKVLLWPDISFVAWQGERPIGVIVCVPDMSDLLRDHKAVFSAGFTRAALARFVRKRAGSVRVLLMGVEESIQNRLLGAKVAQSLLGRACRGAQGYGATHAQLGWVLDSNKRALKMVERTAPSVKVATHEVYCIDV